MTGTIQIGHRPWQPGWMGIGDTIRVSLRPTGARVKVRVLKYLRRLACAIAA